MDTDQSTQLQLLRETREQKDFWATLIADSVINNHPITESSRKSYAEARDEYLRILGKLMGEATDESTLMIGEKQ